MKRYISDGLKVRLFTSDVKLNASLCVSLSSLKVPSAHATRQHSIHFVFIYIYFASPFSEITNLPQRALQSVHIDIPDL